MARPAGSMAPEAWTTRAVEADLSDLRLALAAHPFPSDQDHLIAGCVARRTPSRLLWRLACLSRTRTYLTLDDVCDEVCRAAGVLDGPAPSGSGVGRHGPAA